MLTKLRGKINTLRVDVDQLRSTNICMLCGEVRFPDMLEVVLPFEMRVDVLDGIVELLVDVDDKIGNDDVVQETNEDEFLRTNEHLRTNTLIELQEIEESIVHVMMERSCLKTSLVGTYGVSSDSTITHTNVQGTNTLIDTTMQPVVLFLFGIDDKDDVISSEPHDLSTS